MRALGVEGSFLLLRWMEPLGRPKLSLEGEPQLPSMLPPCLVKNSESLPEVGTKECRPSTPCGPNTPPHFLGLSFPSKPHVMSIETVPTERRRTWKEEGTTQPQSVKGPAALSSWEEPLGWVGFAPLT